MHTYKPDNIVAIIISRSGSGTAESLARMHGSMINRRGMMITHSGGIWNLDEEVVVKQAEGLSTTCKMPPYR
jgi:hypothetical protein